MAENQMFVWHSEFLAQYGRGYIIAIGTTVQEARSKARSALFATLQERIKDCLIDEDDYEAKRAEILRDIAAAPTKTDVLLIGGSE